MSDTTLVGLVALAMAVGVAGTVVPLVPGLGLVWLAALAYGLVDGFGVVGSIVFVTISAMAVVGFAAAAIRPEDSIGEVLMLAVDPQSQNRGLGTTLPGVATDWIRESGMPVAFISTGGDPGHAPARRTYAKAGYRELPVTYYLKVL